MNSKIIEDFMRKELGIKYTLSVQLDAGMNFSPEQLKVLLYKFNEYIDFQAAEAAKSNEMNEDQFELMKEMLELTIKAGRRLMHDFDHMLGELALRDLATRDDYEERAKMWRAIFYPDNGSKNYRAELHRELDSLDSRLAKAHTLLKKHGIDPNQDEPF